MAVAALPLLKTAVKLHFPAFLLSERRKTWKWTLPPNEAAVKLHRHPNSYLFVSFDIKDERINSCMRLTRALLTVP